MKLRDLYYTVKPLIPRSVQVALRRQVALQRLKSVGHIWPIDPNSGNPPVGWRGWPQGKEFALVLSHDVDTRKGYKCVPKLAELEEQMGLRSQFNFVPERYGKVEIGLLNELKRRGFGIGVHGLKHDGKLFRSKAIFSERAPRINAYLKEWGTKGFTTPSMIRNHDWMHELNVDFCISTFDTDPFEPQSDGVSTIFPYWVKSNSSRRGFLELPYTLVQDFTLFVLLREKTIDLWRRKLDWIASKGGMALLNSHPDYMDFENRGSDSLEYAVDYYTKFLEYVKNTYADKVYHAPPADVAEFYRSSISLSCDTNSAPKRLPGKLNHP
jgi:hypothetical protein